jgi:nitrate/TMAO reductase-like tetraheme cytochrome c subunit
MTPSDPSSEHSRGSDLLRRIVWFAAAAYVLVTALAGLMAYSTGLPAMCTGCHEMQPSVATWQASPHARAGCPQCHEPVTAWYDFPATFVFRSQMLKRDWDAHNANPNATALTTATISMRPIPDANCLQCHDLTREVTLPPGLTMDHAKHVARNKSCISCHRWTAHPPPASEAPLLLMAQCFNCHGRVPGSKAPGRCDLCHPKTFAARPQSHTPFAAWLAGHGKIAKVDRQPCAMCHDDSFCRGCHGIDMPHPAGWVKGGAVTHSQFAKRDPQVCVHCHGPEPNLCSMCHHRGLGVRPGTWATSHSPTVNQRGAAFCMSCHNWLFCQGCHGLPGGPSSATTIPPGP